MALSWAAAPSQLLLVPQANHLETLDLSALPPAIRDYLGRDEGAIPSIFGAGMRLG